MLALPVKGFQHSVNVHRVDPAICCDWMEACALFSGGEATGSDIVDLLRENEIYETQDFAWELVENAFAAIRERARVLGAGYPIRVRDGTRVVAQGDWDDYTAYAFCLVLSLSRAYPAWWRAFGVDYGPQGQLFEDLTAESLTAIFTGWTVHQTGWSATNPNRIAESSMNLPICWANWPATSGGGARSMRRRPVSTSCAFGRSQMGGRAFP